MESVESPFEGKSIFLQAMGCRTNQYEADALACTFRELGGYVTEDPEGADIAIINTCTVTSRADRKVRQAARRIKRTTPSVLLVVCGCWAQCASDELARSLGIDILVGNRLKSRIPKIITDLENNRSEEICLRLDVMRSDEWDGLFMNMPVLHTRAFVKVQDGCSHFCSYCIIPYVRGREISRPSVDVIKEITCLAGSGVREVVLTGVHLGSYRDKLSGGLAGLVKKLRSVNGIERIRFGSIEPFSLSDELLDVLRHTPNFCPHLHIPLQSGDDGILSRMKRGYSSSDFLRVTEKARSALGDEIHISTDVMTGFPGETEEAFGNTLKVMEKAAFGKVHVFPFSPRQGTPAFSYSEQVPSSLAGERAKRAAQLGDDLLDNYCSNFEGKALPVLVEKSGKDGHGLIPHFIRVNFDASLEEGKVSYMDVSALRGALKGTVRE